MNYCILNIPEHKNCTNCGKCCGIIPSTKEEVEIIRKYIAENGIKPIKGDMATCPFRDEVKKKCLIYPVRPLICRLFGVTNEGVMRCPNGNSADIDGKKFLPCGKQSMDDMELLNYIKW